MYSLRPGVRSLSLGHPPPGKHGSIVQQPENPPKSAPHLYQVPPSGQLFSCLLISKVMLVIPGETRWNQIMTSLWKSRYIETTALQLPRTYTCLAFRLQQTRRHWMRHYYLKQLFRSQTMLRIPQGFSFVWLWPEVTPCWLGTCERVTTFDVTVATIGALFSRCQV